MNNDTALTTVTASPPERFGAFSSPVAFEAAQRMAKLLCASTIVPESYRNNLGDAVIALEMSNRIGANPLAVMQNLYIVHGRPAWSSQFLIACVNASGRFSPLRYSMSGEGDDYGRVAWANDRGGERLEGPRVTIAMAKAEGWHGRNGSKWRTMPDLMLRYRAATLFARLYAPELTMGIQTDDEIIDIAPVVTDPVRAAKPVKSLAELKREPSIRQAAVAEADNPISPEPAHEQSSAGKEEKQEAPAPGPATGLTARQKSLAELLGRIFNEVPGSGWDHVTAFLDVKFPGRKLAEVSDLCDVPDDVAGEVCNKSVSLRKFVSDLLSAQKGGAK